MNSVTHRDFTRSCTKAIMILALIATYCIYSYFKYGIDISNFIIFISSVVCILAVIRLVTVGEDAIAKESYKISTIDSAILGNVLILLLGILSIYIFAYKGIYGMYKSFSDFSITSTIYYISIIILAYQLVLATSHIQTVINSIKRNNITRQ